MNARDYKIRTILVQRGYIEKQLSNIDKVAQNSGMIDYPFIGEIYPENIKYFNDLGYEVVRAKDACDMVKARPIYIIYPSEEIVLTDEELKLAEDGNHDLAHDDETLEKFGMYNFG